MSIKPKAKVKKKTCEKVLRISPGGGNQDKGTIVLDFRWIKKMIKNVGKKKKNWKKRFSGDDRLMHLRSGSHIQPSHPRDVVSKFTLLSPQTVSPPPLPSTRRVITQGINP